MVQLSQDGTTRISLDKPTFVEIARILKVFCDESHSNTALLADSSGTLIALHGSHSNSAMQVLATLAAADYAATAEMSRLIEEPVRFRAHFYEGQKASLYITGVEPRYFLTSVFDRQTAFGMVRIKATKAVSALEELLSRAPSTRIDNAKQSPSNEGTQENDSYEFQSELSRRLEQALTGKID